MRPRQYALRPLRSHQKRALSYKLSQTRGGRGDMTIKRNVEPRIGPWKRNKLFMDTLVKPTQT